MTMMTVMVSNLRKGMDERFQIVGWIDVNLVGMLFTDCKYRCFGWDCTLVETLTDSNDFFVHCDDDEFFDYYVAELRASLHRVKMYASFPTTKISLEKMIKFM